MLPRLPSEVLGVRRAEAWPDIWMGVPDGRKALWSSECNFDHEPGFVNLREGRLNVPAGVTQEDGQNTISFVLLVLLLQSSFLLRHSP